MDLLCLACHRAESYVLVPQPHGNQMASHWGASFGKSITNAHVPRAIAGGRAFFSMQPMCGMR